MKLIEAIILGIVQGITEFIPVSSSGHLVLVSRIMGIESEGITFEILLHAATLAAVMLIFRREVSMMIKKPFSKLTGLVILATIPAGLMYLLFKDRLLDLFETGSYLGAAFIATALLLLFAETGAKRVYEKNTLRKIRYTDSAMIGVMQGIAMIPGVSRSGATLSAGLFLGLDRDTTVRFSFLISIPAILGALAADLLDVISGEVMLDIEVLPMILGMAAAFISGYAAIRFLIGFVARRGVKAFSIYLFVIGTLVTVDKLFFGIFM